jgi:hypothetical protein
MIVLKGGDEIAPYTQETKSIIYSDERKCTIPRGNRLFSKVY